MHEHTHVLRPSGLCLGLSDSRTNLDFTEARDSEWQWYTQICTLPQTDNHASSQPLSFLQTGCPSCHSTNSIKALKAILLQRYWTAESKIYMIHTVVELEIQKASHLGKNMIILPCINEVNKIG